MKREPLTSAMDHYLAPWWLPGGHAQTLWAALYAQRHFGPTPLTGVAFHDGQVYVLNFGASKLQRLPARFDADSAIEDVATFATLSPPAPPARRIDNPDGSHDTITFGSQGFPAINGIETYGIFALSWWGARLLKLPHDIAGPACLIGTSNFFELAVAVAISLFGLNSGAALATVVGVLIEVPVMLSVVRIVNASRGWYERR